MAASPAQKRAEKRDLGSIVPKPTEREVSAQAEKMRANLERSIAKELNESLNIARAHNVDLPRINLRKFSLTQPKEDVVVVQSNAHLFVFNAKRGSISVDGKVVLG